jgi:hypothetical protein
MQTRSLLAGSGPSVKIRVRLERGVVMSRGDDGDETHIPHTTRAPASRRERLESSIRADGAGLGGRMREYERNRADRVMFLNNFIVDCSQRILHHHENQPESQVVHDRALLADAYELLELYHEDLRKDFEFPYLFYDSYIREFTDLLKERHEHPESEPQRTQDVVTWLYKSIQAVTRKEEKHYVLADDAERAEDMHRCYAEDAHARNLGVLEEILSNKYQFWVGAQKDLDESEHDPHSTHSGAWHHWRHHDSDSGSGSDSDSDDAPARDVIEDAAKEIVDELRIIHERLERLEHKSHDLPEEPGEYV